ncbi:nucleotidyltransferase family protein [Paracoccus shandongensis]|uniref:nucleotidyltransferase family protein n=1 Tax=Paracoccus shandongensis TaxID=2816048 RepID=UPI001A8CC356|nr:nucleotidyltransferase family protein [Paracoccus shandongensis]
MTIAALLLAAGASRRFGEADKLAAPFDGLPLVVHAARALTGAGILRRLAVVRSGRIARLLENEGFATLMIAPGLQSDSIRAGVAHLGQPDARLLIALGDMPLVRAEDYRRLIAAPPDRPACAWKDGMPMPPAIFPPGWRPRLMTLQGDRGAGALLRELPRPAHLHVPAERLADFDHPSDFAGH